MPVAGISFRQAAARTTTIGDEVVFTHEVSNPHDRNAVAITHAVTGDLLGYVPSAGNLNARLTLGHAGGVWAGVVVDRFDSAETIGLRVQVTRLVGHRNPVYGSDEPGLRDLDRDQATTSPATSPAPTPQADPAEAPVTVRAGSGRVLGTLESHGDGKVRVRNATGTVIAYPEAIVSIG